MSELFECKFNIVIETIDLRTSWLINNCDNINMLYGTNVKITWECITVITEKEIAEQNM